MPKVTIDGREIAVPKGTTVLQAAEALGLEVPQMCYHPGLSIVGVCRVCLCRVKGNPKMTPACATEAGEGMEVELYSPEAEKARKAVIEFWLLNHPLDCPVCDQGGECPLQDIAFDHGPGRSRLNDPKVKKAKRVSLGPHVVLDEERCILCWRCTRFTQEISGSNGIMLKDRGVYTTVGTPPGQVFDDPFSGNVVDLCPVGALTSHDFRFKSRVWEMASTESVCTACSVGCNTYVWSKKGSVERLTSRPNAEVNDYWLCDRGRYDIAFVNDPRRLALPRLRVDGTLVDVEWEDAIAALVAGLKPAAAKGGAPAGALLTRHLSNEDYWTAQKFLRSTLGSNHLAAGRDETLDPARVALIGRGRMASVTDIDRADTILVLGGDLEATHPVHALRVRKAVRRSGARLLLATPRAGSLDLEAAASERVAGAEAPNWLRDIAAQVRSGAEDGWAGRLRASERLVVLVDAGPDNRAIAAPLEELLGAASGDTVWRTLMLDPGGNVAGAMALGISPRYFPGYQAVNADHAARWKSKWGGRVSGEPGMEWNAMLEAAGGGGLSALLLVNAGRPAGWNFSNGERELLARAPFVAAFDFIGEEVESFAHLILPTTTFAESDATYTTQDGVVQLARRNIVPRGVTLPAIIGKVSARLGTKMKGPDPIEVFRELAREVPQYHGLDYGQASREGARAALVPVGA